jgi:DNA repair protein RadA/Sms
LFLSERGNPAPGSVVFAGIEGTRPILCEIQALVAPAPQGQARRSVVGWDGGRLAMILAVLESRCGIAFAGLDVYLNVAGGLRISEPAADLAVAAALVSAREGLVVDPTCVIFGEISLSGAIRPVSQTENRLKEAQKLGFTSAIVPQVTKRAILPDMTLRDMHDLAGFVADVFGIKADGRE